MHSKETMAAAKRVFDYLYLRDNAPENADLIIGFGHFDLAIPRQCGRLFIQDCAKHILLTGGRGAGTADLDEPEGLAFYHALKREFPVIPDGCITVESESTNTGENIRFSETIFSKQNPDFCFEKGIGSVIAVCSPYRQRRVYLTLKKLFPTMKVWNIPPKSKFTDELTLFVGKNEDLVRHVLGEVERIRDYPERGFIEFEPIPEDIMVACSMIKQSM